MHSVDILFAKNWMKITFSLDYVLDNWKTLATHHFFLELFSETHPQIKFEDGSVKQNILIACTGLALAHFFCLKWQI